MNQYIDQASDLLKKLWKDKNVHIVQKKHYLAKNNFCLIDISLDAYGQDQDKMYVNSAFYRANIRRGNTLIEFLNLGNKQKNKIQWARKGTQKIIDIKLEYLEHETKKQKLNGQERKSFEAIFSNVNNTFLNGRRVQIVKTQKANGQNAQVSYNYDLDVWVICSKNVSLLANSIKDLQIYDGKRYNYAKEIAIQWFKEIRSLKKEQIKKLKQFLDGFTLVGQYCGNPSYQHLIRYNQIRIIWFALVDNYSNKYCFDPFYVKKQIEEFDFKFVKIKRYGCFTEKQGFYKALEQLYLKTAQASIEDIQYGMEGSIVYFVCPQVKDNDICPQVLGSGKLKTIQYRFFRKIRQKLSRFMNQKESLNDTLSKYYSECLQLEKSNKRKAPYPFLYYQKILKIGCQMIKQTNISEQVLRTQFVSILKLLLYVIVKNLDLKKYSSIMINNQNFIDQLSKLSFSRFGSLGCNTKIIYLTVSLPQIFSNSLSEKMQKHFLKINLPFKVIKAQQQIGKQLAHQNVNHIISSIQDIRNQQTKHPFLKHYYIDGQLSSQQISLLSQNLYLKGEQNIYHKIILLKDDDLEPFYQDYNQYPFSLETILLSYILVYQQVKNCPTIQQKIVQLRTVTDSLSSKANFNESINKINLQSFPYSFSRNITLSEQTRRQCQSIVAAVISGQDDFTNYCKLILKLEKLKYLETLSEEQIDNEIEHMIKSSFPIVPTFNFKKQMK